MINFGTIITLETMNVNMISVAIFILKTTILMVLIRTIIIKIANTTMIIIFVPKKASDSYCCASFPGIKPTIITMILMRIVIITIIAIKMILPRKSW